MRTGHSSGTSVIGCDEGWPLLDRLTGIYYTGMAPLLLSWRSPWSFPTLARNLSSFEQDKLSRSGDKTGICSVVRGLRCQLEAVGFLIVSASASAVLRKPSKGLIQQLELHTRAVGGRG